MILSGIFLEEVTSPIPSPPDPPVMYARSGGDLLKRELHGVDFYNGEDIRCVLRLAAQQDFCWSRKRAFMFV